MADAGRDGRASHEGGEALRLGSVPLSTDAASWSACLAAIREQLAAIGAVRIQVDPESELGRSLILHEQSKAGFLDRHPLGDSTASELASAFRAEAPVGADGVKVKILTGGAHSLRLCCDKESPSSPSSSTSDGMFESMTAVHAHLGRAVKAIWHGLVDCESRDREMAPELSSNVQLFLYTPAGFGVSDVIDPGLDGLIDYRLPSSHSQEWGTPEVEMEWREDLPPVDRRTSYKQAVRDWIRRWADRRTPLRDPVPGTLSAGLGAVAHLDNNLLTAVTCASGPTSGGIQVLVPPVDPSRPWSVLEASSTDVSSSTSPSFLLFAGAAAQRTTMGRLPATVHRVVLPSIGMRASTVVKLGLQDEQWPIACRLLSDGTALTTHECSYAARLRAAESLPGPSSRSFVEANPSLFNYHVHPRFSIDRLLGSWYHERRMMRLLSLEEVAAQRFFALAQAKALDGPRASSLARLVSDPSDVRGSLIYARRSPTDPTA